MKKDKKNSTEEHPDHIIQTDPSLRHKAEEQLKKKQSVKKVPLNEELRIAEEKAKKNIEKFTAFYDFAPAGYFTLSYDGTINGLNLSGAGMLCNERTHLVNSNFRLFVAKDTLPDFDNFLQKTFETNTKQNCEVRLVTNGNTSTFVHLEGLVSDKEPECLITAVDITEYMQAEEAIRLNEARLRQAELASKSGNWELHLDSRKIHASEGAIKLYGVGKDQFEYEVIKEIPLPEYRPLLDAALKNLIEENKPYDIEYKIKTADTGEIKDVHSIARFDNEKRILFGIIQDITRRKLAEDALRESEQLFQGLFNASPDAIVLIDPHHPIISWPIVDCNEAACKMNGFTREEMIGHSIDLINTTVGAPDERIAYIETLRQKGTIRMETYHRHKNGQIIVVEVSTSLVTLGGREMVIGIDRDITERMLVEKALRESEFFFKQSQHAAFIGSYKFDLINGLWESSEVLDQIFGIDKNYTKCLQGWLDITHPEEREMMEQYFSEEVLSKHKSYNKEYRIIRKSDGEIRWLIGLGELDFDDQGQVISMIGTIQDITHRKRAEEESRESEERFRMVFENIFDGIVIYEEYPDLFRRKLVDCNEQYAAMAGIPREELLKFENTNDIQISLEESSNDARLESLSTRKSFRGSYSWIRPDGKDNIIEYISVPTIWRGKSYAIGIDRDITGHKRAEAELIAAKEKAEESDRLKSAFLANMSHEIRTPLNSIIGFSELMTDPDYDTAQQLQFARIIIASGNNLLAIISDIMDISKIESGQVQVKKRLLSVNQLIFDIQKEYSFIANEKGIELRLDPSNPNGEIFVESDETKLRQILVNFVGNAIKFTKDGFIEIGFKIVEGFVQFRVKDTGIGIPKEFHEQIFERFRQVETANTRKYGGNGLGLAISKGLVELLEGSLWMESELGKGSTFYFMIPISEKQDLGIADFAGIQKSSSFSGK